MGEKRLLWILGLIAVSLLVLGFAWTLFRWAIRLALVLILVFVLVLWWKDRNRK